MGKLVQITAFGETKCYKAWERDARCVVSYPVIRNRMKKGWTAEQAITIVPNRDKQRAAFGEVKTIKDWSLDPRCKVSFKLLHSRLHHGWSLEDAIMRPFDHVRDAEEYVGKTFGGVIKVLSICGRASDGNILANCQCLRPNCQRVFKTRLHAARRNKSCGCLKIEKFKQRATRHGMSRTTPYILWVGMNDRCYDSTCPNYKHYGARGISVCEEWRKTNPMDVDRLKNFVRWYEANPRPSLRHTLDRKDNDGPYSPDNCKWSTISEQNKNKRGPSYYLGIIERQTQEIEFLKRELKSLSCPS